MTNKPAILLALIALTFGAAACDGDGDDKGTAKGTSPSASGPPAAPPSAPSTAPVTVPSTPPVPKPSDPWPSPSAKVPTSKTIVMIDPQGKKYTYTEMAQLAAGMRATMNNPPKNFCAASYQKGVEGGGRFPAGRAAWMSACEWGWKLGRRPR